ncbi:hypothetical protein BGW80DRAFT_382384 [Lactifluus volemus]|nr:hypothetical protein BGW80DRAFT_382384 [Lactifluus volemus]
MEIVQNSHSTNPSLALGQVLLAVFVNAYLFGVVSQQFYIYWTSDFNDTIRIKIFVVLQFLVVTFQAIMLWALTWNIFITNYGLPLDAQGCTWGAIAQSVGQNVLVLSANMFLAIRILHLTDSRLQAGLVIALSASAFIVGIVNIVITWDATMPSPFETSTSLSTPPKLTAVVCHALQAIAECLITIFLSRALLKSRSGIRKTDGVVNCLIRKAVQIGFFATAWTIAGLTTWFFLPKISAYMLFSSTIGPMYTNVIFETLLSRVQLRRRMAETSSNMTIQFSSEVFHDRADNTEP